MAYCYQATSKHTGVRCFTYSTPSDACIVNLGATATGNAQTRGRTSRTARVLSWMVGSFTLQTRYTLQRSSARPTARGMRVATPSATCSANATRTSTSGIAHARRTSGATASTRRAARPTSAALLRFRACSAFGCYVRSPPAFSACGRAKRLPRAAAPPCFQRATAGPVFEYR